MLERALRASREDHEKEIAEQRRLLEQFEVLHSPHFITCELQRSNPNPSHCHSCRKPTTDPGKELVAVVSEFSYGMTCLVFVIVIINVIL